MFDLFRSREKAVRYLLGGLLTLVALSMVTYLIPSFGNTTTGTPDNPTLATIGDYQLTASDAQQEFKRITSGRIPDSLLETYFPQVVDNLVLQHAAIYQAEKMGFTVSDDEILTALAAEFPQFFSTGSLAKDQLDAALAQQGMTMQNVLDDMRDQLLLRKFRDALVQSVVVSPKEVENTFVEKNEKFKVQYIAFPPAKFRDKVKVTDDDLKKAFERDKAIYAKPEKFAYQVLVLDQAKLASSLQVSDDELRAAYASALDNFRTPERAHVRHILLSTQGKSDADKKPIQAKAEDLLKQIKGGADFGELAKNNSIDAADKGGDIGWIVRGQMLPEFDSAAFALKAKETSGVITTPVGYDIIQVLEKEPAKVKSFDEVKAELATDVRAQKVVDQLQSNGDKMHDALVKSPKTAEAVAKQFDAELITVPGAAPGDAIPGLGNVAEFTSLIPNMKPDDVSALQVLPNNKLAVAVLNARIPGRPAEFSEVAAQVKDKLVDGQSIADAEKAAKDAAEELKKGEDIAKVAKSYGLEVVSSNTFGRADAIDGLGQAAYFDDLMPKPVGSIGGPISIQGRNVVAKLTDKTPADMTAFPIEKEAILNDLKQKKAQARGSLLMDSIMAKLAQDGKIKINRPEIQRVMATYHNR